MGNRDKRIFFLLQTIFLSVFESLMNLINNKIPVCDDKNYFHNLNVENLCVTLV